MKNHITKLVAVVMAVLMMVSLVPAAALSDFNLPELFSVFGGTSASDEDNAAADGDNAETAIPTEDGTPVSKAGGDGVYMAADGTLYMDTDNDGTAEAITGDAVSDEDAPFIIQQGKVTDDTVYNAVNNGTTGTDAGGRVPQTLSAYEPTDTNNEDHPFLPGGAAWIDLSQIYYGAPATQNYPLTKWSANTSVYNITEYGEYTDGKAATNGDKKYAFRDRDMIDGYTWSGYSSDPQLPSIRGSVSSGDSYHGAPILVAKNGTPAYAYNRYDAMQGKYGITFDKNVKTARWNPSWVKEYYGADGDLYNSVLYLSDTPYLYFSTEALDTTKISISLLIGAPVQEEKLSGTYEKSPTQTVATNTNYYEYRWYTITDNTDRPGIDPSTMDNSMIPIVTISDVVAKVQGENATGTSGANAYYQQNSYVDQAVIDNGTADPIALATAKGIAEDSLYVNGSITGCLDFTNLLPIIMGSDETPKDTSQTNVDDQGREDVQYKVSQIRVDTKTAEGAANSAFRINYLYFGPSLSTSFSPQNLVGQNVDAQSWQYKQTTSGDIGDSNTSVGAESSTSTSNERAYTNGWENGAAVSYVNTPNTPQKITVDTYGQGNGKLIEWSAVPPSAKINKGSNDSKVWQFTDKNGKVQYMEAERKGSSGTSTDFYVMVTVPVRKWINVLGESRKISLTATLLNKGQQNSNLLPTFVLWGNEDGSVGAGHSGTFFGTRFRNEDLIMVFAGKDQAYHVDQGDTYVAAEVDRTIGDSLIYNTSGGTEESWFDILRSPYVYDETVKNGNSNNGHSDELVGYTFITALRFTMPVGSAISVQNMKGDGNSAGLNSYSTTGNIVNAYDGGTGEQPIVDVSGSLPEKNVTITKKSGVTGNTLKPTDFNYTFSDYGDKTIKGHITSGAAAYGPMLRESFYTIYDLLDTEMIWESCKESHHTSYLGKNNMPVYGQVWRSNQLMKVYSAPFQGAESQVTKYGHIASGCDFVVYAVLKFTEDNSQWGMTGILTSGDTPEVGFVCLSKPSDSTARATEITSISNTIYGAVQTMKLADYKYWDFPRDTAAAMKNQWTVSNMLTDWNSFYCYDNKKKEDVTLNLIEDDGVRGQDIVSDNYGGPTFKYANIWTGSSHTSAGTAWRDAYLRSVDGTEMEFGFERRRHTGNWSVGMTRVLDNPVELKKGDIHNCYPVLYMDYTSTNTFATVLSLDVDGVKHLWYVYENNYIAPEHHSVKSGNNYMYLSFKDIMTQDFKNAESIKIEAVSLYMWVGGTVNSANINLRRLEVWQEETAWLDDILTENGSTAVNAKVADSMNIVNDAFFHYHNESADGSYTIAKNGGSLNTNTGINEQNQTFYFTITDNTTANSYKKTNSNKGWKAYIRTDSNNDGMVNEKDQTFYSYDATQVEGAYQYFSSLGHLRVWSPAGALNTSVVFEADRSFSTKNYKYLYYSYSMRDTDTGIAAEEPDTARNDGLKPGIAVSIKSNQLGSDRAYSEVMLADGTRTWAYYDTGNAYWSEDGRDNRTFKTTINAAADLSTFDGIEAVNQFVFYLSNPTTKNAEFYINYIYLSNVPPTDLIKSKLEEQAVQYYYLMDNTGDRYSARFPTIDNPTGAVSGLNSDNDRNNPIIVNRGDRLSDGHYFNGDPLYGYGGTSSTSRNFNENVGTPGYYEKTYGHDSDPNGEANGSFRNIWFYDGGDETDNDYTDIKDMYKYKERNNDGSADIYDMLWSYGRWYLGAGESGLNNMFIGQKNDPSNNETANAVSGNLVRRYATENYVLLRSGIEPRKYDTYYDSMGGQFVYDRSNPTLQQGIQLDENSYYVTSTVLFSPYTVPLFSSELVEPQKYGYIFEGWYTNIDIDTNQPGSNDRMYKYNRKQQPGVNYFYAKWKRNESMSGTTNTATFYKPGESNATPSNEVWFTQQATYANDFKLTLPEISQFAGTDGSSISIRGWRIKDTDIVFAPGKKIVLSKPVTFVPEVNEKANESLADVSVTVTLTGAKLYLVTDVDANGKFEESSLVDLYEKRTLNDGKGYHGMGAVLKDGKYTYYNIPRDVMLVAKPTGTASSTKAWQVTGETTGSNLAKEDGEGVIYLDSNASKVTVVSTNKDYYQFTAYQDTALTYATVQTIAGIKDGNGALSTMISSSSSMNKDGTREMMFVSSFDLSGVANANAVAWGTIYTTNASFSKLDDPINQMKLNPDSITTKTVYGTEVNGETIGDGAFEIVGKTGVRLYQVKATSKNKSNQYYLRITDVKSTAKAWCFARSYVIYTIGNNTETFYVAYSNVVRKEVLDPVSQSTDVEV